MRNKTNDNGKIIVSFGKSSSIYYSTAVEIAKQYHTYRYIEDRHIITLSVDELGTIEKLNDFCKILDFVGNWKLASFEIDGESIPFSEALDVLNCYKHKLESYAPDEFCFGKTDDSFMDSNIFGCAWCGYDSSYRGKWFKEGELSHDGIFYVDKERIENKVRKNLSIVKICPVLDIDGIIEKIGNLPEIINPKENPKWVYLRAFDSEGEEYIGGVQPAEESLSRSFEVSVEVSPEDTLLEADIEDVSGEVDYVIDAEDIAEFLHNFYDSLQNKGFTSEETIQIVKDTVNIYLPQDIDTDIIPERGSIDINIISDFIYNLYNALQNRGFTHTVALHIVRSITHISGVPFQ